MCKYMGISVLNGVIETGNPAPWGRISCFL